MPVHDDTHWPAHESQVILLLPVHVAVQSLHDIGVDPADPLHVEVHAEHDTTLFAEALQAPVHTALQLGLAVSPPMQAEPHVVSQPAHVTGEKDEPAFPSAQVAIHDDSQSPTLLPLIVQPEQLVHEVVPPSPPLQEPVQPSVHPPPQAA